METNETPISANTLVKQPVDQALYIGSDGTLRLKEKWKGQYQYCLDVARHLKTQSGTVSYSAFYNYVQNKVEAYQAPTSLSGFTWYLEDCAVNELQAGTHGTIELDFANLPTQGGGGGGGTEYENTIAWTLQWCPENYSPYAYCKNPTSGPELSSKSCRWRIEGYLNMEARYQTLKGQFKYQTGAGKMVELNDNEKAILDKIQHGKYVQKSHPMITRVQTFYDVPMSQVNAFIQSKQVSVPDEIQTPDQPFSLNNYQWVSRGTNVNWRATENSGKITNVTYSTTWEGGVSADVDFYGPNKWELGQM